MTVPFYHAPEYLSNELGLFVIMINWKIDAGIVTGLALHDGNFLGADFASNDSLIVKVQSVTKDIYDIELSSVTNLNIRDFWRGNVIGEVFFLSKERVPLEMWKNLFYGQLAKGTTDQQIHKMASDVSSQNFFSLECSYGAQVYVACDQMQVSRKK